MSDTEKELIDAARKLSGGYADHYPEGVLFGFAKLASMDYDALEVLLSTESITQMEAVRDFFKIKNIDARLFKQYFSVLAVSAMNLKERSEKLSAFFDNLGSYRLQPVLEMSVKHSVFPLEVLFAPGAEPEKIFEYQKQIRTGSEKPESVEKKIDKPLEEKQKEASSNEKAAGDHTKITVTDVDQKKPVFLTNVADFLNKNTKNNGDEISSKYADLPEAVSNDCFSPLRDKYKKLRNDLLTAVHGQEQAILKFIQGYNQGELLDSVEKRNGPKANFFFFGPPGTGKTLLANTAAKSLGIPYKLFNMSGYLTYDSQLELTGVGKQYKNSVKGELTGFVHDNPECVLIFDEFEKAHMNIIRLFLQILGSGTLRDACLEKDVDFSRTIIIFTSNVGRTLYDEAGIKPSSIPLKVLISALKEELPPEICSRLGTGNVIMFNHMSIRKLANLAEHSFEKIADNIRKAYGMDVTFSDKVPMFFLLQYGSGADARIAGSQSEIFLKNEIYNLIERESSLTGISNIHFEVRWDEAPKDIQQLFNNETVSNILVFCSDALKKYFDETALKYGSNICVHYADNAMDAKEKLENQIDAVFIDPLLTAADISDSSVNVFDHPSESNNLFRELTDMKTDMPVFILEDRDIRTFTDAEKNLFLQEGAFDVIYAQSNGFESFSGKIMQIMEELYMEERHQSFSGKGFVLDYNSKPRLNKESGRVEIVFYDLKKIDAVDAANREMVLSATEKPDVRFSDVIGAGNAKDELGYFINYLKNPKSFVLSGRKPPKGVLLFGPPGTGKTMLAKAMAGESEVAFLQTSASEFKNKYVGESEANIRRIFATAKKYAPSIIFIDEIDAIGKKRTGSEFAKVEEGMLNALLTEIDGFDPPNLKRPVFVLAATNFGVSGQGGSVSAELDEALLRRFDNKIYVDLPNKDERQEYIDHIINRNPKFYNLSKDAVDNLADRTTGQSLAILQNIIELAIRNAQKKNTIVDDGIIMTAFEDYMYGERKEFSPDYYRGVAIHEAGHAWVSYKCGEKPSYITIESRGNFGGYMQRESNENVAQYTRDELLGKIRTALAGRAAELVFFGRDKAINTGASGDLEHASNIAFNIVGRYGMGEDVEMVVLGKKDILGSELAGDYVGKVNALLKQEMDRAVELISEGRDMVESVARELERENHMTGARFEEIVGAVK